MLQARSEASRLNIKQFYYDAKLRFAFFYFFLIRLASLRLIFPYRNEAKSVKRIFSAPPSVFREERAALPGSPLRRVFKSPRSRARHPRFADLCYLMVFRCPYRLDERRRTEHLQHSRLDRPKSRSAETCQEVLSFASQMSGG